LLSNRAACYIKLGDASSTLSDCNLSLELDPTNVKSLLRRASAYEMKEKYQLALEDYRYVLRTHPSNPSALDGINRTTKAIRSLGPDAPSSSTPKPAASAPALPKAAALSTAELYELWKSRGNDYVKGGDFSKAVECYNQCVSIDSSVSFAYNNRAHCHLKLNMPTQAAADATAVLRLEPQNVKALYRRAQARISLEQFEAAHDDLSQILALDPSNAAAKTDLNKIAPQVAASKAAQRTAPQAAAPQEQKKKARIEEIDNDTPTVAPKATESVAPQPAKTQPAAKAPAPATSSPAAQAKPAKVTTTNTEKVPATPVDFIRLFTTLKSNDDAFVSIITRIPPSDLPRLFGSQLEADHLATLARLFVRPEMLQHPRLFEYMASLSKVPRFDMMTLFMADEDQSRFASVFKEILKTATDVPAVQAVKAKFAV
jgi:tetratricopeptide (TPR) repeat protein